MEFRTLILTFHDHIQCLSQVINMLAHLQSFIHINRTILVEIKNEIGCVPMMKGVSIALGMVSRDASLTQRVSRQEEDHK